MLTLDRAMRLSGAPVVAIVGAGGKTAALFLLARALEPSIVTTTTHLGEWQVRLATRHRIWPDDASRAAIGAGTHDDVLLITGELDVVSHRYRGLRPDQVDNLVAEAGRLHCPLLVEADGSKQLPLKAPAAHEPPIPARADVVIVAAGMGGLGKPLTDETVHRPEAFASLAGIKMGDSVSSEAVARVLTHPEGGLKNVPAGARRVALLNQADTVQDRDTAAQLANLLLSKYSAVVVSSLRPPSGARETFSDGLQSPMIHAVHEPVAAVVLAAGGSSRYGEPKQLLDYHGTPFVRAVAEVALSAGLSPVVVVTGAVAEGVERALGGLGVRCAFNPDWPQGQSGSVRVGVGALPAATGAAVFMLADQPQVPEPLLRALVARHRETLAQAVVPYVGTRRATPTLFDRAVFPALQLLSGDSGGRSLLAELEVERVLCDDSRLLLDVDTPEDYSRLIREG